MPKLVDYSARFEFLRRAAFTVVRDQGPQALSRYTIGAALGTSANTVRRLVAPDTDLRQLAADEVQRRRRHGRWGRPRDLPREELALHLLRGALPDASHRIAEELVWWRLELEAARIDVDLDDEDTAAALRRDYQVADLGYVLDGPDAPAGATPSQQDDSPRDPIAHHRAHREEDLTVRVADALRALGVADAREAARTRALLDGLGLSVCLGRISPADAVTTLEHHLTTLTHGLGSAG